MAFSLTEVLTTSLGFFIAAIHVAIGILCWHPEPRHLKSKLCIVAATSLTGLYCITEALTYSGIFRYHNFFVLTTFFAGYTFSFYYIWAHFFLNNQEPDKRLFRTLFLGIFGSIYTLVTLSLNDYQAEALRLFYIKPHTPG